jgi:hypothetical protein
VIERERAWLHAREAAAAAAAAAAVAREARELELARRVEADGRRQAAALLQRNQRLWSHRRRCAQQPAPPATTAPLDARLVLAMQRAARAAAATRISRLWRAFCRSRPSEAGEAAAAAAAAGTHAALARLSHSLLCRQRYRLLDSALWQWRLAVRRASLQQSSSAGSGGVAPVAAAATAAATAACSSAAAAAVAAAVAAVDDAEAATAPAVAAVPRVRICRKGSSTDVRCEAPSEQPGGSTAAAGGNKRMRRAERRAERAKQQQNTWQLLSQPRCDRSVKEPQTASADQWRSPTEADGRVRWARSLPTARAARCSAQKLRKQQQQQQQQQHPAIKQEVPLARRQRAPPKDQKQTAHKQRKKVDGARSGQPTRPQPGALESILGVAREELEAEAEARLRALIAREEQQGAGPQCGSAANGDGNGSDDSEGSESEDDRRAARGQVKQQLGAGAAQGGVHSGGMARDCRQLDDAARALCPPTTALLFQVPSGACREHQLVSCVLCRGAAQQQQ